MDMDKLYQEYRDICEDRGAFAKTRAVLHKSTEEDWLIYVIQLIAGYPSRDERRATIENEC